MQDVCANISRCVLLHAFSQYSAPSIPDCVGLTEEVSHDAPPSSSRRSLCLLAVGPSGLTTSPFSPAYALKWLSMAERFQVREWCRGWWLVLVVDGGS